LPGWATLAACGLWQASAILQIVLMKISLIVQNTVG
jgi:hypothetical protein